MAYAEKRPGAKTWRARYKRPDGTVGSEPGFRTRKLAEKYGEDQEAAIRAGTWIDPEAGEKPLGEWWVTWIAAQEIKPNSVETYTQHYRKHIAPRWGSTPLAAIRGIDIDTWLKELRPGLSGSAMTIITTVMRGMLEDAAFNDLIGRSPMPPKKRGRAVAPAKKPRPGVVIPLETVERILMLLPSDADRLIVLVALFTGMRWSEIAGMRVRHLLGAQYLIDPQEGALHDDASGRRFYGPPKSGPGRLIDLPAFLAELLRRHVATLGKEADVVFTNRKGGTIGYDTWMQTRWRRVCDGRPASVSAAGRVREAVAPAGPGLVFHDLKHTHAAMLDDLGTHSAMRHYRLGHVVPGAPGVYSHPTVTMRADVVAGLQGVWEKWQFSRSAPVSLPPVRELAPADNVLF